MKRMIRTNRFGSAFSPLISDQVWLLAILAAGSFVFAMVTVFVVSMFTDIRISAWSIVGSIAPWYIAIMSGWIVYFQVPLFVAHGRTRKAGYREWINTLLAMVPVGAVLMAIGFQLERGIYHLAGFNTSADRDQYVNHGNEVFVVLFQYVLTFAVWFALGGFAGASLYKSEDWGWVSIPIAIGIVSLTGVWNHTSGGFFAIARRVAPGINYESYWLDLGLSAVASGLGVWLVWILVYNLPLRNP